MQTRPRPVTARKSVRLTRGVIDLSRSRLFWQTVIATCILLCVMFLSKFPLNTSRVLLRAVRYTVSDDYDIAEVFKRLPSIDEVRDNYVKGLVDWLKQSNPRAPAVIENPILPLEGRLVSGFGWRRDPVSGDQVLHEGVDLEAAEGTPIRAVLSGLVSSVRESPDYGKVVTLDHGGGLVTLYAHCSEILVEPAAKVDQGDVIALVGKTGNAESAHLHFELIEDGRPVDPLRKLLESGAT